MIVIVNEPQVEYKVARWQKNVSFQQNQPIMDDNGQIIVQQPTIRKVFISQSGNKKRLSSLRGKLIKQDEREVDDQIRKMRDEWNRDI